MNVLPQPVRNCGRHPSLIPVYVRVRHDIKAAGPRRMLDARHEFKPEFAVEHIPILAAAYRYMDDTDARTAGRAAAARGWMTRDELVTIGAWKTNNRQRHNLVENTEERVREATGIALTPGTTVVERLDRLCSLLGVGAPVASALLHFADPDGWSLLDFRILQSVGVEKPSNYRPDFFERFQRACGGFCEEARVSRRVFDKAGFTWSRIYGRDLPEEVDDEDE